MKVLSLYSFQGEMKSKIENLVDLKVVKSRDVKAEDVEDVEIIIGNIDTSLLKYARRLKWLQLYSAGSDTYKEEMLPKDCVLTNASGTFGLSIHEHLLMCTLMLMRNMQKYVLDQEHSKWQPVHHNRLIYKSVFVIVGCGDIGQRFAKTVQFMGGYTIGVKRRASSSLEGFDELYTVDELDEVLPRADVVCLSVPRNKDSNHLLNSKRLKMLKQDALVLNVGRSNSIDVNCLCELLNQEKIAGAHLDVFDEEPIPEASMLWKTKNLIITPHVSGTFANQATRDLFEGIVINNLNRFINAQELENIVDFKSGYRKKVNPQ